MSNLDKTFPCELGEVSFREYFQELLTVLIKEEEGFSGKRPFGNSGWFGELTDGLTTAGLIDEDESYAKVESVLIDLIKQL